MPQHTARARWAISILTTLGVACATTSTPTAPAPRPHYAGPSYLLAGISLDPAQPGPLAIELEKVGIRRIEIVDGAESRALEPVSGGAIPLDRVTNLALSFEPRDCPGMSAGC